MISSINIRSIIQCLFVLVILFWNFKAKADPAEKNASAEADMRLELTVRLLNERIELNKYYKLTGQEEKIDFVLDMHYEVLGEQHRFITKLAVEKINDKLDYLKTSDSLDCYLVISIPDARKHELTQDESYQQKFTESLAKRTLMTESAAHGVLVNIDGKLATRYDEELGDARVRQEYDVHFALGHKVDVSAVREWLNTYSGSQKMINEDFSFTDAQREQDHIQVQSVLVNDIIDKTIAGLRNLGGFFKHPEEINLYSPGPTANNYYEDYLNRITTSSGLHEAQGPINGDIKDFAGIFEGADLQNLKIADANKEVKLKLFVTSETKLSPSLKTGVQLAVEAKENITLNELIIGLHFRKSKGESDAEDLLVHWDMHMGMAGLSDEEKKALFEIFIKSYLEEQTYDFSAFATAAIQHAVDVLSWREQAVKSITDFRIPERYYKDNRAMSITCGVINGLLDEVLGVVTAILTADQIFKIILQVGEFSLKLAIDVQMAAVDALAGAVLTPEQFESHKASREALGLDKENLVVEFVGKVFEMIHDEAKRQRLITSFITFVSEITGWTKDKFDQLLTGEPLPLYQFTKNVVTIASMFVGVGMLTKVGQTGKIAKVLKVMDAVLDPLSKIAGNGMIAAFRKVNATFDMTNKLVTMGGQTIAKLNKFGQWVVENAASRVDGKIVERLDEVVFSADGKGVTAAWMVKGADGSVSFVKITKSQVDNLLAQLKDQLPQRYDEIIKAFDASNADGKGATTLFNLCGAMKTHNIPAEQTDDILLAYNKQVKNGQFTSVEDMIKYVNINGCFVAGTPVWTAEGMKAIETIEKGQRVYAFDPHELKVDTKAVMHTFIRQTETLIYLTVKGQEIVTTPEHPFFTPRFFRKARDLLASDSLWMADQGFVPLENIVAKDTFAAVYNFETADWHTYFVGEQKAGVHNRCSYFSDALNKKLDDLGFSDELVKKLEADLGKNSELLAKFEETPELTKVWRTLEENGSKFVKTNSEYLEKFTKLNDNTQGYLAKLADHNKSKTLQKLLDSFDDEFIDLLNYSDGILAKGIVGHKVDITDMEVDLIAETIKDIQESVSDDLMRKLNDWHKRSEGISNKLDRFALGNKFEADVVQDIIAKNDVYKNLKTLIPDLDDRKILKQVYFCITEDCSKKGGYFIADLVFARKKVDEFNVEYWDIIVGDTKLSKYAPFTENQKASASLKELKLKSNVDQDIYGNNLNDFISGKKLPKSFNEFVKIYSDGQAKYVGAELIDL